ncbi:MAG: UDP-N-acetylmuramate dehydrogenase [Candidatus Cloacimonetes bacterium]|nr:UDP-N-acetylmuramate dehydrogenase [Candidatus Cloacimonadota bacterium]
MNIYCYKDMTVISTSPNKNRDNIKSHYVDLKILSPINTVGSIGKICFPTSSTEIQEALYFAKENHLKPYFLGGGSNTLIGHLSKIMIISDRDYPEHWDIKDDQIIVSSNTYVNYLVINAAQERLYGLEFLAGIPAHLGGLIYMNAGAYERNISDFIEWITVVDESGEKKIEKNDIQFGYRSTNIKGLITKICFKLHLEPDDDYLSLIKAKIEHFTKDRESKHPMNFPSLGCFFKNPVNQHAGYLIEKAGLKSYQIGGAMVSPKHGNFLINVGNAKFEDFIDLINHVQNVVYEKFGIKLELEIKIINE